MASICSTVLLPCPVCEEPIRLEVAPGRIVDGALQFTIKGDALREHLQQAHPQPKPRSVTLEAAGSAPSPGAITVHVHQPPPDDGGALSAAYRRTVAERWRRV
ncbi:hypothetical protein [Streptomyces sp. NBC_00670]|uniref:hypothetical protein n=1 Tax=Streptomyces sp. NBC_00670 TaxID=2975804 RepID=UPI002E2F0F4C|nr:hypothetical protein [Streptomyces sp. NBC_00670]